MTSPIRCGATRSGPDRSRATQPDNLKGAAGEFRPRGRTPTGPAPTRRSVRSPGDEVGLANRRQPGETSMITIVFGMVLPWLLTALGAWLGYQLLRQNGR